MVETLANGNTIPSVLATIDAADNSNIVFAATFNGPVLNNTNVATRIIYNPLSTQPPNITTSGIRDNSIKLQPYIPINNSTNFQINVRLIVEDKGVTSRFVYTFDIKGNIISSSSATVTLIANTLSTSL